MVTLMRGGLCLLTILMIGAPQCAAQSAAALQQALLNRPSEPVPPPPPIFLRTLLGRLQQEPPDRANAEEREAYQQQVQEALVHAIEAAPYVFVPTAEEIKQLKEAGASDRVLEALKTANANIREADASGISPLDRQLIKQLGEKSVNMRAKAAQMLARRQVKAAVPGFAVLIASDLWETGAALPIEGAPGEYDFYLYLDASREIALKALLELDRPVCERALLKAMDSTEPKVRQWATDVLSRLADESSTSQ
jgi:hypothetical protein